MERGPELAHGALGVAEVGRSSPGAPRHRAPGSSAKRSAQAFVRPRRGGATGPARRRVKASYGASSHAASASRRACARSTSDVALKRWAGRCPQHQAATALDRP